MARYGKFRYVQQVNISWLDLLLIGAASGVVAAGVSGVFATVRDRALRRHDRTLRLEEKTEAERKRFLPLAIEIKNWIDYDMGVRFGPEFDYYPTHHPSPLLGGPGDAIGEARTVADEHSDPSIRATAEKLASSIDGAFNMREEFQDRPTLDEMQEWRKVAGELIDAIRDWGTKDKPGGT